MMSRGQTSPKAAKPKDPESTGFVAVEQVLHEYRDRGKSPTLDQWSTQVKERLQQYRTEHRQPKAAKEAQAVETALALASELIQALRAEAGNAAKKQSK
jgi:hypothetical protein